MKNLLIVLCSVFLVCCSRENMSESKSAAYADGAYLEEQAYESEADEKSIEVKIIKEGFMRIEDVNLKAVKMRIDSMLNKFSAYYQNAQYNDYEYMNQYSLVIRIPSENFEKFITQLESGMGRVSSKQITNKDVSEEYLDQKIRLDNTLAYLEQYREILKKARTISEILAVQEKIRVLEQEIDARKGRLQFLDDRVSLSTLQLELVNTEIKTSQSLAKRIGKAFKDGSKDFVSFLISLVTIWPFLIIITILIFAVLRHRKKRKNAN